MPKPAAAIDFEAREKAAALGTSVQLLKDEVVQLSQRLDEVYRTDIQRISVQGFSRNGVALLAEQRMSVLSDFRKALSSLPAARIPNVLLIGYADGTGVQAYNADLALRRAASVANFLRQQDFGRRFHTEITSGGVFDQANGDVARRVDILVSTKLVALNTG